MTRETAQRWLGGVEERSQDSDTTEENLGLVEKLWRADEMCAAAETHDPALGRLVRKLSTT